jgi:7,8-dihydro-6-hydroxymethylpterin-pyrophosphokinase
MYRLSRSYVMILSVKLEKNQIYRKVKQQQQQQQREREQKETGKRFIDIC